MVDFQLAPEQEILRQTLAEFARERVRPAAGAADEAGAIDPQLVREGWELGLISAPVAEWMAGETSTRSALTGAIAAEELAWGDLAIALRMLVSSLLTLPLIEMGTDAQRRALLPRFAGQNPALASAAVVEARFDYSPGELQTRARRIDDGFVLDGKKCLVPAVEGAELILVYAASEEDAGRRRHDAFIVPADSAGVARRRERNMGLKALETYELTFDGVRVEASGRLGGERAVNYPRLISQWRAGLAAMAVGVARAAFEYARDYARERKAFGAPIATKQAVAFMLADMAIEVDASRLLAWETAWRLDRGQDAAVESELMRRYVANATLQVTDSAVQVLGGHGYIREHPVELWLRNARGFCAFEGLTMV